MHNPIVQLFCMFTSIPTRDAKQLMSLHPSSPPPHTTMSTHAFLPNAFHLESSLSPLASPTPSFSLLDEAALSNPSASIENTCPIAFVPKAVSAKMRIERPKGARWKNLLDQLNWKDGLLVAVKVGLSVVEILYLPYGPHRIMPGAFYSSI